MRGIGHGYLCGDCGGVGSLFRYVLDIMCIKVDCGNSLGLGLVLVEDAGLRLEDMASQRGK